jgi:hypothetical protein
MDHAQKLLLQCAVVLPIIAPLALWVVLYSSFGRCHSTPTSIHPIIRFLRWLSWASVVAFLVDWLAGFDHYHAVPLGIGLSAFSTGLSFPESCVKQRVHHFEQL